MTSLLGRLNPSSGGTSTATTHNRFPAPVRVRRPVLALTSVAVVFASIAIFMSIYAEANHQLAVITITHPVLQGQRILASDLGVVHLAISGSLSPVPVTEASVVVGKRAAVTLVPGSLLTMADVSTSLPIALGDAVVGLALKDGQLPSSGVEPGDHVMVIQTGTPGTPAPNNRATSSGGEATTGVLVPDARVYGVALPLASSSSNAPQLVSIEVSSTVAAEVSIAAAADQVSLVLLPQSAAGT